MNKLSIANPQSINYTIRYIIIFGFFILTFFTIMGTDIPFQERDYGAAYEQESTNPVNQVVYLSLFVSAIFVVSTNFNKVFNFIIKEKYISLLILYCLLSAVWSDYSFISIKRSFQLLVMFMVIMNALIFIEYSMLLKILKAIMILYIVITYFSIIFIPAAIDPAFNSWRGIEIMKNGLGQMGFFFFMISLFFYSRDEGRKARILNLLITSLSIILVLMSTSSTSITALIVVCMLYIIFSFEKLFAPLGIGKIFSFFIIGFLLISVLVISLFSSELFKLIPAVFDKSISLTGRTFIWEYVWTEIQKKIFFGYGFGTYWIMGTSVINRFVFNVGWKVNEAHSGYLEILLQLGFIGFLFFLMNVFAFMYRIYIIHNIKMFMFLASLLVINITEATIFQTRTPSTFFYFFIYIATTLEYFNSKMEA